MPTLPSYSPAGTPDAWHRVTAPGGYEWWYFDAEDAAQDVQVVAIFLEGFVFHPGYLRKYQTYARNPTRHAPPVASEYPCAYFVVYEKGKLLWQFMTQYPASAFSASAQRAEVSIGPNRFENAEGLLKLALAGVPWGLTARGPKLLSKRTLSAELSFRPLLGHAPREGLFFSREMAGAEHHWVMANPLCHVEGKIRLDVDSAFGARIIPFRGRGYHDHNFGTGPIGPGLRNWIWGRALFADRAVTFHHARPRDRKLADETHVIEADGGGVRDVAVERVGVDWSKRTALLLAYPRAVDFGEALVLSRPRVVDASPFYLRLIYDAVSRGERGTAFCEVAYPHRLLTPVLGRMIEMSIHRAAWPPEDGGAADGGSAGGADPRP